MIIRTTILFLTERTVQLIFKMERFVRRLNQRFNLQLRMRHVIEERYAVLCCIERISVAFGPACTLLRLLD